jgi:malonate-semialdehyde dehydrogenase (acetylating) / methylmalonate-semialdehyde dehydrogenase
MDWRHTPPLQRIQHLFKLKRLLDDHFDEIARLTVLEYTTPFWIF